ncbi:hypothetical protein D3C81_2166770 [compost metagenome]
MIGRNEFAGLIQRISFSPQLIGSSDGHIVDQRCVDHVAEVQNVADHIRLIGIDDDVVEVEVVMNDLSA